MPVDFVNNLYLFKNRDGKERYYRNYNQTLKQWPVPFDEHYVKTSFGDTYIIECGKKKGEPVVFMHGLMDSSATWFSNVEGLGKHYRLILIDSIMDTGKSRPVRLPLNIKELTDWFSEVIGFLNVRKAHLVGHSIGGFVSFHIARRIPERINKLILLAPTGVFSNISLKYIIKAGLRTILFPGPKAIDKIINLSLAPANSSLAGHPVLKLSRSAALNSKFRSRIIPLFSGVKKYEKPVLLLLGEYDWLFNMKKTVNNAEKNMAYIKIEIINGAGHMLHFEKNATVNAAILNFLDTLQTPFCGNSL